MSILFCQSEPLLSASFNALLCLSSNLGLEHRIFNKFHLHISLEQTTLKLSIFLFHHDPALLAAKRVRVGCINGFAIYLNNDAIFIPFDYLYIFGNSCLITKWNSCHWHHAFEHHHRPISLGICFPLLYLHIFPILRKSELFLAEDTFIAPYIFEVVINSNVKHFRVMNRLPSIFIILASYFLEKDLRSRRHYMTKLKLIIFCNL